MKISGVLALVCVSAVVGCARSSKASKSEAPPPGPVARKTDWNRVAQRLRDFSQSLDAYSECVSEPGANCEVLADELNHFDFGLEK